MRAWWGEGMQTGLLYGCTHGDIRPDCPCALVKRDAASGRLDVIPNEGQVPDERSHVRRAGPALRGPHRSIKHSPSHVFQAYLGSSGCGGARCSH